MAGLTERMAAAERALTTFVEVKGLGLPALAARDVAILRFTYTFEAIWKATQLLLAEQHGVRAVSPKTAIRSAREIGWLSIEDTVAALKMADDRNLAAHVYNEKLAAELGARLAGHGKVLARWLKAMLAAWRKGG